MSYEKVFYVEIHFPGNRRGGRCQEIPYRMYATGQRVFDGGHAISGSARAHGGKEFGKVDTGAEVDSGTEMFDGGLSAVGAQFALDCYGAVRAQTAISIFRVGYGS
jgi:hypothetical protein